MPAFHRTPIRGSQQPIYIGEPLNPFAFVLHLYLRHLRNWEEEPPNVHIRVIVAFRPLSRAVDASAHRITLGAGGLDVVLFFGLSGSVRGVFLLPEVAVWFALLPPGQIIVIRVRRSISTSEPRHCYTGFKITPFEPSITPLSVGMSNAGSIVPLASTPRTPQGNHVCNLH